LHLTGDRIDILEWTLYKNSSNRFKYHFFPPFFIRARLRAKPSLVMLKLAHLFYRA